MHRVSCFAVVIALHLRLAQTRIEQQRHVYRDDAKARDPVERMLDTLADKLADRLVGQGVPLDHADLDSTSHKNAQESMGNVVDNLVDDLASRLKAWPDHQDSVNDVVDKLLRHSVYGEMKGRRLQDSGHDELVNRLVNKLADKLTVDQQAVSQAWTPPEGADDYADLANTTLAFPRSRVLRATIRTCTVKMDSIARKGAKRLDGLAQSMPRVAASCAAATLAGLGDLTAQRLEAQRAGTTFKADIRRSLATSTFQACMAAGFWVPWYSMLGRTFGEGSVRAVLSKLSANNFLATPFFSLPAFISVTSLLRGHDSERLTKRLRETYGPTLRSAWSVMVPGNLVIWSVISPHLRVPFAYVMGYLNAIVCSLASNPMPVSARAAVAAPARIAAPAIKPSLILPAMKFNVQAVQAMQAVALSAEAVASRSSSLGVAVGALIGLVAGSGIVFVMRYRGRGARSSEEPLLAADLAI